MQKDNWLIKNRKIIIDHKSKSIRLARLEGSKQSKDSSQINCDGFGRIRRVNTAPTSRWHDWKLPYRTASRILNITLEKAAKTQTFQICGCNMSCWFCFVDTNNRYSNPPGSELISIERQVDLLLNAEEACQVIVLSGGLPMISPEWLLWNMQELEKREILDDYYIWVDDNLTLNTVWSVLSRKEIEYITSKKQYGIVGCFKSFSKESFSANTGLEPSNFDIQLQLFSRYWNNGFNIYGYVILACIDLVEAKRQIPAFIESLRRNVHHNAPLRIVPIEIKFYNVNKDIISSKQLSHIENQYEALNIWNEYMEKIYSTAELNKGIELVEMGQYGTK